MGLQIFSYWCRAQSTVVQKHFFAWVNLIEIKLFDVSAFNKFFFGNVGDKYIFQYIGTPNISSKVLDGIHFLSIYLMGTRRTVIQPLRTIGQKDILYASI